MFFEFDIAIIFLNDFSIAMMALDYFDSTNKSNAIFKKEQKLLANEVAGAAIKFTKKSSVSKQTRVI